MIAALNASVRGVPVWRWLCFFGFLVALGSFALLVVLALVAYPLASTVLLAAGIAGAAAAHRAAVTRD